jgi:hypothetical protein
MPAVMIDACGPRSPDSHRVVWGLTSWPPVPPRAFLRFPVCPPGSSPSPAFPWFPVVRRSPVRLLRPLPGFRFPFGFPPGSLPRATLMLALPRGDSAGVSPGAAGTKVTSSAAAPCLDRATGPHYIHVQHPTASRAAALPVPGRSSRSLTIRSRPMILAARAPGPDARCRHQQSPIPAARSARAGKAHARAAGEPGGNEHGTGLAAVLGGGTAVTGPACGHRPRAEQAHGPCIPGRLAAKPG